jgi:L-cysteine/cystine lyase
LAKNFMTPASDSSHHRLDQHRQQFPALANKAYFNFGGQGPMSSPALKAIQQTHDYIQQAGPFSSQVNQWVMRECQQTRAALASELGVPATTVTLTEDVTVGCNIALWGIEWQAGDHLLLSDCEHPGVVAAAVELGRRFEVEVTTCALLDTLNAGENAGKNAEKNAGSAGDPVRVIAEALRPTTRLVVISHILWNTGQVLPLAAVIQACRDYGRTQATPVRVLVDAAQSVGMLPLDLDAIDVDFYAFTGHKWLCGPAGVGGLYVSEAANPTFIGWRGVTKNAQGYPTGWQPDGSRYEVATSDYALYPSLRAALELHQAWGTAEERYQQILALSQLLWQQLSQIPAITCLRTAPPESGLVSFQVHDRTPSTHERFTQALEQQGFLLRTILDPTCVRACVHYFTTEAEIGQLIEAIQNWVENYLD